MENLREEEEEIKRKRPFRRKLCDKGWRFDIQGYMKEVVSGTCGEVCDEDTAIGSRPKTRGPLVSVSDGMSNVISFLSSYLLFRLSSFFPFLFPPKYSSFYLDYY